jgi:NADPH:quinone reductase-like Zn-dependent oxidoreductase
LLAGGGLAEFAVARATSLITVPDDIGPAAAATLLLDYLTASYALFDRGQCQAGETVLVLGASGGVGCAAVRLAADAGARVIAAASTAEKRNYARHAGAWATVDYTLSTWRDRLRQLAPGGVDIVVDPIGGDTFEPAFRSLAKGGRHLVLGFVGGAVPALPINLPLLKNGALVGVDARHLFESDLPRAREIWANVLALAVAGRIQPPAIQSFRLSHARNALHATLNRGKLGKIVVQSAGAA